MNFTRVLVCVFLGLSMMAWSTVAHGYAVGPALNLEKLADESDIIFKGTVISSAPVKDEWFKPCPGFEARETRFTVISMIKGDSPGVTLSFRHYDNGPPGGGFGVMYTPLFYSFKDKSTCIVFARKTDAAGVFRQFSPNHTSKQNQGVLRCSNDKPTTTRDLKEVFWNELLLMLNDKEPANAVYAIGELDLMSVQGDNFDGTHDFDRRKVLEAVRPALTSGVSPVAQAALTTVGSRNPYMTEERAEHWLATVGSAETPGLATMDPKLENTGGKLYWKELQVVADSKNSADTRALAIRALGLVRESALRASLSHWLVDPEESVRAAATVLLADFPGTATNGQLTLLDADPSSRVRMAVAQAIGFSQQKRLVRILGGLLGDRDAEVRRMASTCLLSFSPKDEAVARVFQDAVAIKEFDPLFLNALARENPASHLDDLARVVEDKAEPTNWRGGEIPAFTAWKTLFKHLAAQPPKDLQSGKLDHYLDALEKVGNYSSSEPRDLYAFFLLSGMPERAKKFRGKANKASTYDLDYYFKQVDQDPAQFKRQ